MLFHFYNVLDALCERSYQFYNDAIINSKTAYINQLKIFNTIGKSPFHYIFFCKFLSNFRYLLSLKS